jgi:hypothetical protein
MAETMMPAVNEKAFFWVIFRSPPFFPVLYQIAPVLGTGH